MFWELIATLFAGLGAAGLALMLRALSGKRLPRWLIPACAGLGMLGFQVYSEYTWFGHQKSLLPDSARVVRTVEETSLWRPWSLLFPQILRFMAIDREEVTVNRDNPDLVLTHLYLFERRLSARRIPQVIHCGQNARADFAPELPIPEPGEPVSGAWHALAEDDPLLMAVCDRASSR